MVATILEKKYWLYHGDIIMFMESKAPERNTLSRMDFWIWGTLIRVDAHWECSISRNLSYMMQVKSTNSVYMVIHGLGSLFAWKHSPNLQTLGLDKVLKFIANNLYDHFKWLLVYYNRCFFHKTLAFCFRKFVG